MARGKGMDEFLQILVQHIETVEGISNKIESGEAYMQDMKAYMPSLQSMIKTIFDLKQISELNLSINTGFVVQVLNDIVYGIENEDTVFLLDTLRYGLLEVYYYIGNELQGGNSYE